MELAFLKINICPLERHPFPYAQTHVKQKTGELFIMKVFETNYTLFEIVASYEVDFRLNALDRPGRQSRVRL